MKVKHLTTGLITKININFVIRVYEHNNDKAIIKGAGQIHKFIGEEKTEKIFNKALQSPNRKPTFKLRDSYKLVFHSK